MSEMEPREEEIDRLLRRSMSAPIPRLSLEFQSEFQSNFQKVRRGSQPIGRYGRILLAGYGVISAATSIFLMRGQGLGWGVIAAMTIGPLAVMEAGRRLRRSS
jgi:hypothetical protein